MAVLSAHLDDDIVTEEEVHPSNDSITLPVDHLRLRPGQACLPDDSEEPALE